MLNETKAGVPAGGKRPPGLRTEAKDAPKLTLEDKRRAVLEWFDSDSSIREFRAKEKNVPRPFIRKACKALDLVDLRKKRDEDGVRESVEVEVLAFRPGAKEPQKKKIKVRDTKYESGANKGQKLSIERKRQFFLEWFASDSSIRDFRRGDRTVPRQFIRRTASALGLEELRAKRGEDGVNEIAKEKIMTFRPGQESEPGKPKAGRPKLTLDEKRQFVLDWFASDSSIRDFRKGDKTVPRNFIRRAANVLGLEELRAERGKDGVDEIAKEKIMTFRPGQKSEPGKLKSEHPKLTLDEKRQFVLAWFASDSSIRDFRKGDKTVPRNFIRMAANKLDLRELRKQHSENGLDEITKEKIMSFRPGQKSDPGQIKMQRPKITLDEKRLFVLEWFASDSSIRDFRKGDKTVPRNFIRKAADELGLRELRKQRSDVGVDEATEEKIRSFRPRKDLGVARGAVMPAFNPEAMKGLLLGWYDDPLGRAVPRFLKDKGAPDATGAMMRFVKDGSLRKLRKHRADPCARNAAIAAILEMVDQATPAEVPSISDCQKRLEGLELEPKKVVIRRDMQRSDVEKGDGIDMKGLLTQWYDSTEMLSIAQVLRQNGALNMKAEVTDLIAKSGLRKLRKEREDPEAREKAMKKIDELLADAPALVGRTAKVGKEPAGTAEKEKIQSLLLEFFFEDDTVTVHDFLESRGEIELQKEMGRCVRKLHLNKLKKKRLKVHQKVTLGIENLFLKKGGPKSAKKKVQIGGKGCVEAEENSGAEDGFVLLE